MKHEDIKLVLKDGKYIGEDITICGWVKSIRNSKNVCFVELNDGTSLKNLQLVIDKSDDKVKEFFDKLTVGSSIEVNGNIVLSQNQKQNVESKM